MRQFFAALRARVLPEEKRVLGDYLRPEEVRLFEAMEVQDQRHSLDVFYDLRDSGLADDDLLTAALLHDVGKANVGLGTLHRSIIVLLKVVSPQIIDTIASCDSRNWRYPFWVHRHHGEIGADLLTQAGARARVVELVRRHQNPPADDGHALVLYEADGRH